MTKMTFFAVAFGVTPARKQRQPPAQRPTGLGRFLNPSICRKFHGSASTASRDARRLCSLAASPAWPEASRSTGISRKASRGLKPAPLAWLPWLIRCPRHRRVPGTGNLSAKTRPTEFFSTLLEEKLEPKLNLAASGLGATQLPELRVIVVACRTGSAANASHRRAIGTGQAVSGRVG